jgi:hypothetical protein
MKDAGPSDRRKMNFSERMAWLGRMPRPYKILFGSQLLITLFAIRMRYKLIQKQKERDDAYDAKQQLSASSETNEQ